MVVYVKILEDWGKYMSSKWAGGSEIRRINPGFKIALIWIFRVHGGSRRSVNHGERYRASVSPKMNRPLRPRTGARSTGKEVSEVVVNEGAFCLNHLCPPRPHA